MVHVDYTLKPETFYLCINILDRVLSKVKISDEYMLLAVTVIFTASKYEEIYPPELDDFISACPQEIDINDVIKYEEQMLSLLDYELLTISPYVFLIRYSNIINEKEDILHLANLLMDISLFNKNYCKLTESLKAASAIYTAAKIYNIKDKKYWDNYFCYYTDYATKDMEPISNIIINYIKNESDISKLNVYNKYDTSHYKYVSTKLSKYIKNN